MALDLYFSSDRGSIDKKNPNIIDLSTRLNKLPLFPERPDEDKFRNPNGVALKLSNFLSIDPNYKRKGVSRGSKLDEEVFIEFAGRKDQLKAIATEIRKAADDEKIRNVIYTIEDDEQTLLDNVMEGQILYKVHKFRERDPRIIKLKKDQAIASEGKLACEACTFVFEEFYGELGAGFIECHHLIPLSSFKVKAETRLDNLALICSNCHRMLHRSIDLLSIQDLKMMIRYERL